jgi:NADPH2:quinone reductase
MRAIVVHAPGGPEVLQLEDRPIPEVSPGRVLIRVRAFGLNRSEMFTRQGQSGDAVKFPRILGIECVGEIQDPGDSSLNAGQRVAAVMGGMGREYDGGYAEYASVAATQVMPVETDLAWETFAAIPEMFLTAWGSLVEAMGVKEGQTLLVRGGTSSIGMAAATIAKDLGLTVISTTRNESKREALIDNGADHVVIDTGEVAEPVRQISPGGVNGVLELIGTTTLLDSLACCSPKGIVCNTGILGNAWAIEDFPPMAAIPSTVRLTTFLSETVEAAKATAALQSAVDSAAQGRYRVSIDRVFRFDEIVEAHRHMEENRARGKLVVLVE